MQVNDFIGSTAIVTGAGNGIGYEVARHLALRGANVVMNDIDAALIQSSAQKINELASGKVWPCAGDAGNLEVIEQLVNVAIEKFGKLDIAIANAGITLFGDFLQYQPEALQSVMRLNLQGSFFLAQKAAKQMITQQSGGSILFMSSVTGHQAHKNLAAYGMTKAALEMLAKNLVIELSEHHITVNTVAPGATLTERTMEDAEYKATWSRITPMGRPATVEDVANAVLFMVSPAARHITGQNIVVDGGWTAVSVSPY
jgi:glucose 1-dehydrogenase